MGDKAKELIVATTVWAIVLIGIPIGVHVTSSSSQVTPSANTTTAKIVTPVENSAYVEKHGTSDCTSDCSGHDAGYEWARDNDICDPNYDNSRSNSFNEGVQAYAYDNCYYGDGDEPF